jgi:5'-3' exonuclease
MLEQIITFYQNHANAAANGMSVAWQEVAGRMAIDLQKLVESKKAKVNEQPDHEDVS